MHSSMESFLILHIAYMLSFKSLIRQTTSATLTPCLDLNLKRIGHRDSPNNNASPLVHIYSMCVCDKRESVCHRERECVCVCV